VQRDIAIDNISVGDVLKAQGELAGALVADRDSLAIAQTLATRAPGNTDWQRLLALSYERIGDVLVAEAICQARSPPIAKLKRSRKRWRRRTRVIRTGRANSQIALTASAMYSSAR